MEISKCGQGTAPRAVSGSDDQSSRLSMKQPQECLADRLEEIRLPFAEPGERHVRISDEGAQDPAHLGTNQREDDDPAVERPRTLCLVMESIKDGRCVYRDDRTRMKLLTRAAPGFE